MDEKRIYKLMRQKGMTQRELAEKTELTEASISRYIRGDRTPNSKTLLRIAKILNTTTDYLLGNDEGKNFEYIKSIIEGNAFKMTNEQKIVLIKLLVEE